MEHDAVVVPVRKYNPGFLTDDELVTSFCVRTTEFALLVEVLRECTESSNPHQIVIGPRGSGKTSLLLRVVAEARRDPALATALFPVVFAEESYEVTTTGEFWLECLSHLAAQAPCREDDPDLHRTVEELRPLRDDRALADRCLAALLDFADRRDVRLLLVVENLNMLFRDMADPDAGWRLRKILQTEPRIIMFASATSRFDEIDHPDRALYDLFRVRTLRPLDTAQCAVLWKSVSDRRPAPETIRSLEILTGGSPRLISIVARFGAGLSFRDLMSDLFDLVDDHTEYFKGHIESLAAQERRVYLALATLWKPATTREIAEQARLDTSTCSAQLARLGERGVVQVAGGSARRKQYYLTERLYNIYYLLRRRRGPDRLVEALVHFMEAYYSPPELKEIGVRIASTLSTLDAEMRSLHKTALLRLATLPALAGHRGELFEALFDDVDWMLSRTTTPHDARRTEAVQAIVRHRRTDQLDDSEDERTERAAYALFDNAITLTTENRIDDALVAYEELVHRFGSSTMPDLRALVATALVSKADMLGRLHRTDETLLAYDEVVRRFGSDETHAVLVTVGMALVGKARVLDNMNLADDAVTTCEETVHRFGSNESPAFRDIVAVAATNKATILARLNRVPDFLVACDDLMRRLETTEAPHLHALGLGVLANKVRMLRKVNRSQDALATCIDIARRCGENEFPAFRMAAEFALLQKADIDLECRRHAVAAETSSRLLTRNGTKSAENRKLARLIRARARLASGDLLGCEQDIVATLSILPSLGILSKENLDAMVLFSSVLGPARMRDLVLKSPSAALLLPLTAALEQELGLNPRIAREVEEVAHDIRRDLAESRKREPMASSSESEASGEREQGDGR